MMRVDLDNLPDSFLARQREVKGFGPCVLILPRQDKRTWQPDELHMRSLLCAPDGRVISAGLPKFFNAGENDFAVVDVAKWEAASDARVVEKLDGTMIIRSVLGGEDGKPFVHFRTRGSHQLGEFKRPVLQLIRAEYPQMLDPKIAWDVSCIFEYTAPSNRLVVAYSKPRLHLLARVGNTTGAVHSSGADFTNIARIFGVPAPTSFSLGLKNQTLGSVRDKIAGWKNSEGVVLTCDRGNTMIKVKTPEFLRLWKVRCNITHNTVQKLMFFFDRHDIRSLSLYLPQFDHETTEAWRTHPKMQDFLRRRFVMDQRLRTVIVQHDPDETFDEWWEKMGAFFDPADINGVRALWYMYLNNRLPHEVQQEIMWAHALGVQRKQLPHIRKEAKEIVNYLKGESE